MVLSSREPVNIPTSKSHTVLFYFIFKSAIYYIGLVGRLWQIQCIYLDNETQMDKRKKRGEKKKKKRKN